MHLIRTSSSILKTPNKLPGLPHSKYVNMYHAKSRSRNLQENIGFDNIDDAVTSFYRLINLRPPPSVIEATKILGEIVKMKHFSTAISLFKQMEFSGIKPDVFTLCMFMNTYCHLGQMRSAFSVLGKILKGVHGLNEVSLTTLMKGMCINGKTDEVLDFRDEIVAKDYYLGEIGYGTILNGLCKAGAIKLLQKMEGQVVKPNGLMYGTIINDLCKEGLLYEACDL